MHFVLERLQAQLAPEQLQRPGVAAGLHLLLAFVEVLERRHGLQTVQPGLQLAGLVGSTELKQQPGQVGQCADQMGVAGQRLAEGRLCRSRMASSAVDHAQRVGRRVEPGVLEQRGAGKGVGLAQPSLDQELGGAVVEIHRHHSRFVQRPRALAAQFVL